MADFQVFAIDRLELQAAILSWFRAHKPRTYERERRKLEQTESGRRLLDLSQHPEDLRIIKG